MNNSINLDKISIFWIPLTLFIVLLGLFSTISFQVFLNFLTFNPIYDQIISFLVFLTILTFGLIGLYSYQDGNSFLLTLIFLIWAILSIPLGFFKPIWYGVFLICLISIFLTFFGANKRDYYNFKLDWKTKKAKILLTILAITIIAHPVASFSLSQTNVRLSPGEGEIKPRFYYADLPHQDPIKLSENALESIEKHDGEIFIPIMREDLEENSEKAQMARRLEDEGIKINAWLLEDVENGYWANDYNYDSFDNLFEEFKRWTQEENLNFDTIQLDSEKLMSGEDPASFFSDNKKSPSLYGYLSSLEKFYKDRKDPKRNNAPQEYEKLVEKINENFKSSVACYPIIIDDLYDEDTSIQELFAVSTYPPKNWNELAPMIYRVGFYRIVGRDLGSYSVYSYSYSWKERLPQKASISLSRPDKLKYSENLQELGQDVSTLKSLGYDYATVFGLGLFIETHGEEGLNQFLKSFENSENRTVKFSYQPLVSYSRVSVAFFDRLL